jgi:hypothetical protein
MIRSGGVSTDAKSPQSSELKSPLNTESQCPSTDHPASGGTGFSRQFHFWCTDREDAEHTYDGLIRSFEMVRRGASRGPGVGCTGDSRGSSAVGLRWFDLTPQYSATVLLQPPTCRVTSLVAGSLQPGKLASRNLNGLFQVCLDLSGQAHLWGKTVMWRTDAGISKLSGR